MGKLQDLKPKLIEQVNQLKAFLSDTIDKYYSVSIVRKSLLTIYQLVFVIEHKINNDIIVTLHDMVIFSYIKTAMEYLKDVVYHLLSHGDSNVAMELMNNIIDMLDEIIKDAYSRENVIVYYNDELIKIMKDLIEKEEQLP